MDDLYTRVDRARSEGSIAVVCPGCQQEAGFHAPFLFLTGGDAEAAAADPGIVGVRESRGFLVELHADVFLSSDPARGGVRGRRDGSFGVLVCTHCGHRSRHRLRWPQHAFYRADLEGDVLWAYTRAHAEDNLALLLTLEVVPDLPPLFEEEVEGRLPPAAFEAAARRKAIDALMQQLGYGEIDIDAIDFDPAPGTDPTGDTDPDLDAL